MPKRNLPSSTSTVVEDSPQDQYQSTPPPSKRSRVTNPTKKKSSPSHSHSHALEDEYQQVTNPSFVEKYKIHELVDGDCYYHEQFIAEEKATEWYNELLKLDTYQPTLKIYGKQIIQSRKIAAYATSTTQQSSTNPTTTTTTEPLTLKYSGADIIMRSPFPPLLDEIRQRLEGELSTVSSSNVRDGLGVVGDPKVDGEGNGNAKGRVRFNHCMLNLYEDGGVYIGKHSDNLENKVIASLSLGAERTFKMEPREPSKSKSRSQPNPQMVRPTREKYSIKLKNGSLFVMQGRTQEYWKHEIPKEPKVKEGRISLTFRQLVYEK